MLTELEPVGAAELPLTALREHLRLGTGFADDALQDVILEAALRAALAALEARIGRALIARAFAWRVERWSDATGVALPIGPVEGLASAEIEDASGVRTDVLGRVAFTRGDGARPMVQARWGALPRIPDGGAAVLRFTAGFGPWAALPADLRHASLMLAASYYENRAGAAEAAVPPVVAALIAPWRVLRLRAGGAR